MLSGRSEKEDLDSCLHHPGWCEPCTRHCSKLYGPLGGEGVVPGGAVVGGIGCLT